MRFGQRTQNATATKTANTSLRSRKLTAALSEAGLDLRDQPQPSAARLAAEAAFASPSIKPVPHVQAQITVRRAKNLALAERPPEVSTAATPPSATKGPRVFRIDSPRGHGLPPSGTALPPQPEQTTDTQALPPKPRRRCAPEQRPGPVVLVVQAPAVPRPTATVAALPPAPRSQILISSLAQATPVLADIKKAQSFQFIDPAFENHYQRLSRQAEQLLSQIKSPRR